MTVLTKSVAGDRPRRSAFAAAFLSFLFPGLGQLYAGAPRRAVAFAVVPLAIVAVFAGIFAYYGPLRFGLWLVQSNVLLVVFALNIVIALYRLVAVVDAYRLVQAGNAVEVERRGPSVSRPRRSRLRADPLSLVGLAAIAGVLIAGHVAVARWDRLFYDFAVATHSSDPATAGGAGSNQGPAGTPQPTASAPVWNGTSRLNILLVGVDSREVATSFNTDTMLVVSIDPQKHTAAMLSLPRDMLGLPTPPHSTLASMFGPNFNQKINALWERAAAKGYPGGGPQALKDELGFVYGLDIPYYVEVNFQGFEKVVDTFGGVNINVDAPVVDETYPGPNNTHLRVYIEPGLQHMTGAQALIYARSRHGSNDFDRAMRQQKVLTSLKAGADLNAIGSHLVPLIHTLGETVHTDMPEGPDVAGALLDLAGKIKQSDIRSLVFSPTNGYGIEHADPQLYWIEPNVAKIRAAVRGMETGAGSGSSADQLQAASAEQAPIIVQNGTGTPGQAAAVADYLSSQGLNATASTQVPAQTGGATQVQAVNGAETRYPATAQLLTTQLGKPPTSIAIAGAPAEFIVITGTDTPALSPPPT